MSEETKVSLQKGAKVELTKTNAGLLAVCIGLGWDVAAAGNAAFDLDAFAILLDANKKLTDRQRIIFFNNKTGHGLEHLGDNLTGAGDGDDETIKVDFAQIPADVQEVLFCVNIYDAANRKQNFGQVNNAFIRVYNSETKEELAKFDLSENYSSFNGLVMGKIYRHEAEWKFQAVGEGRNGDINEIASQLGA